MKIKFLSIGFSKCKALGETSDNAAKTLGKKNLKHNS